MCPKLCYLGFRMPWRVAVYYWESGDVRVLPLMNALAAFFLSEKQVRPWPCMRTWVPGQTLLSGLIVMSVLVLRVPDNGRAEHREASIVYMQCLAV